MTFLNPILAAVGIACVALPIIIHILMRRRRRPVEWAAMRFLLEAYRQHKKRLKLEQILLLASRCLVVALIALALGRPLLGRASVLGGRGAITLYLLVDNGLASAAADARGTASETIALERHKAAAQALLSQLDAASGDRAALIALGGPAKALISPPSSNTAAVADILRSLAPTDSPTDIPGGIAIVQGALDPRGREVAGRPVVVVLSDFLAGSADTERKLVELGAREGLLLLASTPAAAGPANISLAGLDPLRPLVIAGSDEASSVNTTIALRRTGPGAAEAAVTTVKLSLNADTGAALGPAAAIGQAAVRWAPGQTEGTATIAAQLGGLSRTAAAGVITATIDPDGIAGDNTWRRPIDIRRSLRVGLVAPRRLGTRPTLQQYGPADWVRAALEPSDAAGRAGDPDVEIVEIDPAALDTPRLAGLDAAVITAPDVVPELAWRKVRAFADSGGLVVVAPPAGAKIHIWADAFLRDLALPWTIAREAHAWPEPAGATIRPERPQAAVPGGDLLAIINSELPELSRPVHVFKSLQVTAPQVAPTSAPAPAPGARKPAGPAPTPGVLLALADGAPLILASPPGAKEATGTPEVASAASPPPSRGLVVLFTTTFAFDWSDLQATPLMVPLMQEVLRQGVGQARGSWTGLAGSAPTVPPRTIELRAAAPETNPASIRASGERTAEPLRRSGLWRAIDDTGTGRGLVALNADPAGARCDAQPRAAIASWLGTAIGGGEVRWLDDRTALGAGGASLRSALQRGEDGTRLAFPLLIAALLFAVTELALARWFSHAVVRPPAPGLPEGGP